MANMSIEQTQEQARNLLNSRIESVTALVKARQRITDLHEQLAEAEKENKRAYVRATRDGWSADELKKLGLEDGAAMNRRRNSRKQAAALSLDTTEPNENRTEA
jgi:flagellar biosynthesis/type III secretory pathway protein FliH